MRVPCGETELLCFHVITEYWITSNCPFSRSLVWSVLRSEFPHENAFSISSFSPHRLVITEAVHGLVQFGILSALIVQNIRLCSYTSGLPLVVYHRPRPEQTRGW